MRKLWLAAMTAAFLAGCSTEPEVEQPATFDMTLQATVTSTYVTRTATGCESRRHQEGTNVTVTNATGETVGAGSLGRGVLQPDGACRFAVDVTVKDGSDFYGVAIGGEEPTMFPAEKARAGIGLRY